MDFFTRCWKSATIEAAVSRALALLLVCMAPLVHAQAAADISQLRVERVDDEIHLSAQVQFELPPSIEDALLKGVAMVFVASADVLRERWYWYDKKVSSTERHFRLAYQPLTRRWRLSVGPGPGAGYNVGLALNQSFDTLAQALGSIKRFSGWKVGQAAELEPGNRYKVDFRFRLDINQLPRPFQIGTIGQSDWDLSAAALIALPAEASK